MRNNYDQEGVLQKRLGSDSWLQFAGIGLGYIDMWGGRGGKEVDGSRSTAGTTAKEVCLVLSAWLWKGDKQIRQVVKEPAIYSN